MKCEGYDCRFNPHKKYSCIGNRAETREFDTNYQPCPFDRNGKCTNDLYIENENKINAYFKDKESKAMDKWNNGGTNGVKLNSFLPSHYVYLKKNFPNFRYERLRNPETKKSAIFIFDNEFKKLIGERDPDEFMEGLK